jgi:hypothetical protein
MTEQRLTREQVESVIDLEDSPYRNEATVRNVITMARALLAQYGELKAFLEIGYPNTKAKRQALVDALAAARVAVLPTSVSHE